MTPQSKKTVINILPHQSAYDYFKDKELPGKNWRNKKKEIVGITGNEFPHSLGNAILKLTDIFNYEVWQPDLRADEIISYTFENGLTYRLFPAVNKKKAYGVKIIDEIYSQSLLNAIEEKIRDNNIIIHLNGDLLGFNKKIIEKINTTPTIFSFHNEINLPSTRFLSITRNLPSKINLILGHYWVKRNINKIECITFQSKMNLAHLKRIYTGRLEQITMGCDFSFFQKLDKDVCRNELGLAKDRFILITTANFRSFKQIDRFIKVLKEISLKFDFLYLIVGQGTKEYEAYLQKLAAPLLKKNKVKFVGYLGKELLLKYLNSADLFVSIASAEGGPVSAMEAMACELPIFSTKTGHTAELMEKEEVGCLVEIRNYREWKDKIEAILKNKKLPEVLNRDIAKEHYDWENIAQRFIKIYRDLANL